MSPAPKAKLTIESKFCLIYTNTSHANRKFLKILDTLDNSRYVFIKLIAESQQQITSTINNAPNYLPPPLQALTVSTIFTVIVLHTRIQSS